MDSRTPPKGKRPARGKSVGPRIALFVVLMVVMALGMYFAFDAIQGLDQRTAKKSEGTPAVKGETKKPSEPAGKPDSPVKTDAAQVDEPTPVVKEGDGSDAAAVEKKTPGGETSQPEPTEPAKPLTPEEKKAAEAKQFAEAAAKAVAEYKPAPWPREADLPILKRYDIDWRKAEALLGDIRDDTYEFEGNVSDAAAFYFLLNTVAKLPREAFRPDPRGEETPFKRLLEMPGQYRFVPVTIQGALAAVTEAEFPRPEVSGHKKFWIIDLVEPRKSGPEGEVHTLITLDPPGPMSRGTKIRAKGYFFKVRKYDSTAPDDNVYTYRCPVLIGRYVEPVAGGGMVDSNLGDVVLLGIIGGFVALGAMVFLFLRRTMSRQGAFGSPRRPTVELSEDEVTQREAFLGELESGDVPPSEAMADGRNDDQ